MFEELRRTGRGLKRELRTYRLVLHHPQTPRLPRIFLGLAVGYALMPFDLIPDFIPLLGHLDDAVIVPLLIVAALKLIPREVIEECRRKAEKMDGDGYN